MSVPLGNNGRTQASCVESDLFNVLFILNIKLPSFGDTRVIDGDNVLYPPHNIWHTISPNQPTYSCIKLWLSRINNHCKQTPNHTKSLRQPYIPTIYPNSNYRNLPWSVIKQTYQLHTKVPQQFHFNMGYVSECLYTLLEKYMLPIHSTSTIKNWKISKKPSP